MSFGFGFALPAYPLRGGTGNNPFNQSGPTLDLSFAGVVTDQSDPNGYTLNTNFIIPQYQIAAQYVVWETGVGLVDKTFSQIITFTRASTATYFDSAGVLQSAAIDAPRLDYNPSTLAAQGLLIEEARTNLLTYSEDLTQAAWGKTATTVTSNAVVSPSGTLTADVLIADTATSEHTCDQAFSAVAGTTYTVSAFVKANGLTDIGLRFTVASLWTGSVTPQVRFDLSSATASTITGTPSASSITFVGNGWYRVSMSVACTTNGTPSARLQLMSGSANVFAGNGTDGVTVWGAQLEAGAFPTSYIPTTTTALTRSADVASVNTLSPWYNSVSGTLYAEVGYQQNNPSSAQHAASFNDTTSNNRWTASFTQTSSFGLALRNTSGAGLIQTQTANSATVGATNKIALAISTGASLVLNGSTVATNASYAAPTVTQLELGRQLAAGYFNGWLRRVSYYPRRLSDAELQAITA